MELAAIIGLAIAGFSFAGISFAMGVRNGSLRVSIVELQGELDSAAEQAKELSAEFEGYQERTKGQLAALREEINDLEDLLEACGDPDVIRDRFDKLLQKATGRDGDGNPSPD